MVLLISFGGIVHKANKNATILNDRFKSQYEKFLHFLCQKPQLDKEDLFMTVVYLVAQDRIVEAKVFFAKLADMVSKSWPDEAAAGQANFQQIQYDYLHAYLSLCVEIEADTLSKDITLDLDGIQTIVNKYQDYPVQRWNQLFKDMKVYVDEIVRVNAAETLHIAAGEDAVMIPANPETGAKDEQEPDKKPQHVPISVDFNVGSGSHLIIHHRGVDQVIVEYYAIDAETMFSASPLTFSDQGESESNAMATKTQPAGGKPLFESSAPKPSAASSIGYRLMRPNAVDPHAVERATIDAHTIKVPILEQYQNTNVMVSVSTVPPAVTRTWKAYFSQKISIQCQEHTGTVKVMAKSAAETPASASDSVQAASDYKSHPLRGAYVKVYAELKSGNSETVFWKDGYTDLVGRFDYVTVSMASGPLSSTSTSSTTSLFRTGTYYNNNSSPFNSTNVRSKAGAGGVLVDVKGFVVFVDGGNEGCAVKTVPVPLA